MDREVRYCRTVDEVQIAYMVSGSGPPLVICPYFYESFDNDDITPLLPLHEALANGRTVVRFDFRGTGLSQREGVRVTHDGTLLDLEAVVRAVGISRFDLCGWVTGGFAAIQYAGAHPEEVNRLALYAAFAAAKDVMALEILSSIATLCRTNYTLATQTLADMSARIVDPELGLRLAAVLRGNLSGETLATYLEDHTDYSDLARRITAPALLMHRVGDTAVPISTSQRLASLIPNARLIPLKGDVNYPGIGDWQAIVNAINSFMPSATTSPEPVEEHLGAFRTVLFTDLVGHTAMMRRLGDEKGRAVLREHERITREVLKEHGGAEVKTMGDGFMASFGSVTKAVECAIALQRAFSERNEGAEEPLAVRVGLNAGEPIEEDGDLFGETVILAARIARMAQGGQVLASLAVRELCAGKGFAFADLGEHAMRGFEDPVRVFEVLNA